MNNAQVAMLAASIDQEQQREPDIEDRAASLFTWLQAATTPVEDTQIALIAAALGYQAAAGADVPLNGLEARAARIATDIAALSGGPGLSGGGNVNVIITGGSHTAKNGDVEVITSAVSTSTIVLPAPSKNGKVEVRNGGTGTCTVSPHAAETVTPATLATGVSHVYVSDGTNWY